MVKGWDSRAQNVRFVKVVRDKEKPQHLVTPNNQNPQQSGRCLVTGEISSPTPYPPPPQTSPASTLVCTFHPRFFLFYPYYTFAGFKAEPTD